MNYKLSCISCEEKFDPKDVMYVCPHCEERMGSLEVEYDYSQIQIDKSELSECANIWQFEKILPIQENSYRTHLHVGGTPLYKFDNISGAKEVIIKYDGSNPTGTCKDRGTALVINKAIEYGYKKMYCASTGNSGSSLAGISKGTDLEIYVYAPRQSIEANLTQQVLYGSKLIAIDGAYEAVFDFSLRIGRENNWYCTNSGTNPYLLEGMKTAAFEIIIQNNYKVPEYVFVSVGDGTTISAIYKGFYEFKMLGLTDSIPKLIGVQAQGCAVVKRVFDNFAPYIPEWPSIPKTISDSIAVGNPRDVVKACTYVERSKGFFIDVSDEEILAAAEDLASKTGVFAETAGASAYAGLKHAVDNHFIKDIESACIYVTGNGLKDFKTIKPIDDIKWIKAELEDVKKRANEI